MASGAATLEVERVGACAETALLATATLHATSVAA
jgi:hypothetical protein